MEYTNLDVALILSACLNEKCINNINTLHAEASKIITSKLFKVSCKECIKIITS